MRGRDDIPRIIHMSSMRSTQALRNASHIRSRRYISSSPAYIVRYEGRKGRRVDGSGSGRAGGGLMGREQREGEAPAIHFELNCMAIRAFCRSHIHISTCNDQ